MMMYRVDLHGMTVAESRIELDHILNSLSFRYDELLVVHGYHSHVLLDFVRNEYRHKRIKKLVYSLNPGDTTFLLKSREEMKPGHVIVSSPERKYLMHGEKVSFSRWNEDDFNLVRSIRLNREVSRYLSDTGSFSNEEVRRWFRQQLESEQKHHVQFWPLFDRYKGFFLGYSGIRMADSENKVYELETAILPEYQNKGYGTDSCRRIIEEVFGYIDGRKIVTLIHPDNEPAIKMVEKLGFSENGDVFNEQIMLFFPRYELKK